MKNEGPEFFIQNPRQAAKKQVSYYDETQIPLMFAALEEEDMKWKIIVYIAILTGMRRGEIMGLEWDDIDYINNTINIERTSQYIIGKGAITKDPKNETSKRLITMPSNLASLLKQFKAHQNKLRLEVGNLWKESNRVFTTWDGYPIFPTSITNWFNKFIKKHKLPHITLHGLRHTSATLLIHEGLNVKAISTRLGHADATTTLNIYSHSLKSADRAASDIFDKMFVEAVVK